MTKEFAKPGDSGSVITNEGHRDSGTKSGITNEGSEGFIGDNTNKLGPGWVIAEGIGI